MSLTQLRREVLAANQAIERAGLVVLSFGNASGVDRAAGLMVIKPSGVPYEEMTEDDLVVVRLADGAILDGELRPSSDTPTHLVLYRRFPSIGGIVHTHSVAAVGWAQARRAIPAFGTTHADQFRGPVPVTRPLTADEIDGAYEANTGQVIIEALEGAGRSTAELSGVLVASHGPFTWGHDAGEAARNAIGLEAIAEMALRTVLLRPDAPPVEDALLDRHFQRKHGRGAYYGQPR